MVGAKRRRSSQKHTVDLSLQASDIAKAGAALTMKVYAYEKLVATIEIGQGTFGFKSANKQRFRRIPWSELATVLKDRN